VIVVPLNQTPYHYVFQSFSLSFFLYIFGEINETREFFFPVQRKRKIKEEEEEEKKESLQIDGKRKSVG
jgi:hypothetical protein